MMLFIAITAILLFSLQLGVTLGEQSFAYCSERYGNLTYITEAQMFEKYPPHLLSFPGAGNSWLRLLIEYATGIYTGSMSNDDFEYLGTGGFIGERSCGLRLAALRAHPHFFDFLNGKVRFSHNYQRDKCKRGLIREMKRFVVLLRNPYDSLWSYYQLLSSLTHSDYLTTDTFDASTWLYMAPIMAQHMDAELYRIVKPIIDTYPPEDLILVRYEDLMHPEKRISALRSVIQFMKYDVTEERLQCAFLLADKPFVHRNPHDPKRVPAKAAFLMSQPTSQNSALSGLSTNSGELSTTRAAAIQGMTHHKNLLCELREPFAGFRKLFNYTLLPNAMIPPTGGKDVEDICARRK